MTWFVFGGHEDIRLSVSDSGQYTAFGEGKHDPKPPQADGIGSDIHPAFFRALQRATCSWRIVSTDERDDLVDPSGEGLLQRVRTSPNQSSGMLKYFSSAVGVTAALPQAQYLRVQRVLEMVLQTPSLEYLFAIDFLGFRAEGAQVNVPTWQEFFEGRPYFFSSISVTVRSARDA